ncbi:MAG: hypothetical protein AB1333_00455 [Patescibacteria group bacterium]
MKPAEELKFGFETILEDNVQSIDGTENFSDCDCYDCDFNCEECDTDHFA